MSINGFITWGVNPVLLHFGAIPIRWYGIMYAVAIISGFKIMQRIFSAEKLPHKELERFSMYVIIGLLIGGRLGNVLFYRLDWYSDHPSELINFWKGGFSAQGAAVGVLITLYLYTRKRNFRSYVWLLDRLILTVPLGGFFIRIGSLLNSDITGKQTNLPWGFRFMMARQNKGLHVSQVLPHHPTQIYTAILFLLLYFILKNLYWRRDKILKPGALLGLALVSLFTIKFFAGFLKDVQASFEHDLVARYGLNLDQILSIPFIVAGIIILIIAQMTKPGKKQQQDIESDSRLSLLKGNAARAGKSHLA